MHDNLIAQCEMEPLHRSGAIQDHGTMIVADADLCVTHLAANAGRFLFDPPVIGAPLPDPLAEAARTLGSAVGSTDRHPAALEGPTGWLDVALARNAGGSVIVEITPCGQWDGRSRLPQYMVPDDEAGLGDLRQALVGRVAAMSGFQRVMYYIFREDGDGEVVAESRVAGAYGSYLGLRYPASDVPHIARRLYLLNPWRMISDASAPPVPVLGAASSAVPDLSYSDLRSASPVHCLYLANMGVRASLSFPLVKGDKLLGLVACHHDAPRTLPSPLLEAIAREVRSHALALSAFQVQQRMRTVESLVFQFDRVRKLLDRDPSLSAAWPVLGDWLVREFRADGAWFHLGGVSTVFGLVPDPVARELIGERLRSRADPSLWIAGSLARDFPDVPVAPVAGVIGISVALPVRGTLTIFISRKEHVHEVAWGGKPDKPVQHGPGSSIAPRQSFEKWIEKRTGHCRPWEREERLMALTLRSLLMQTPCCV
jgi:light-regulated signal transduction histidine kinase (bacteriophytochrome)